VLEELYLTSLERIRKSSFDTGKAYRALFRKMTADQFRGLMNQPSSPVAAFRDDQAGKKWGYIDRHGNVVIQPKYDYAGKFVDGLALVGLGDERVCIGSSGKAEFTIPAEVRRVRNASHRRVWFMDAKERWGLFDDRGRVLIPPQYDTVSEFSEGLAMVNLGAKDVGIGDKVGGEWGYVDVQGKRVIAVQYGFAGPFRNGLARVTDNTGHRFIDQRGTKVIDLSSWDALSLSYDFHEGVAALFFVEQNRTEFIDHEGKGVVKVNGYSDEFHEGMAAFCLDLKRRSESNYGFVDKTGKVTVKAQFVYAYHFSDGVAAVRTGKTTRTYAKGDSWGFIDKSGKYVIAPRFNQAMPFENGVAWVHCGGKLVETDHDSSWAGGEWWLIDTTGKKLKSWATEGRENK
jgi:hypothetical protein